MIDPLYYTKSYAEPFNEIVLKINEVIAALNQGAQKHNHQQRYAKRSVSGCCAHGIPFGQSCAKCNRILHFDPSA